MKIRMPSISTTDLLINAGALANTSIWIKSGEMVEAGTGWVLVSSVALGILMSFGPVEIIKKWGNLKPTNERTLKGVTTTWPNPKYWTALTSFVLILISEAAILSPVILAMLTGKPLAETLGAYALAWSAGRVLVSAVALAGLAAVLGAHAPKQSEPKPEPAPKSETAQPQPGAPAAQSKPERRMVRCTEPGCGIEYAWPNGKGAHYKKHHKPIRVDKVDKSLLLRQEKP